MSRAISGLCKRAPERSLSSDPRDIAFGPYRILFGPLNVFLGGKVEIALGGEQGFHKRGGEPCHRLAAS